MSLTPAQIHFHETRWQRCVHGTSAHLAETIKRDGLREPFDGRGVSLALEQDLHVAEGAATSAALRQRRKRGGSERVAEGLLVWAPPTQNLPDVVIDYHGVADRTPTRFVVELPPGAIVRVEVIEVELPPVGSLLESSLLNIGGFAQSTPGIASLPTMDRVRARNAWERDNRR